MDGKNTYELLSAKLFEGKDKSIRIKVVNNELRDSVLRIDGYKHSMVGIIALGVAAKACFTIVNPPLVSDTYTFIALINEMGGNAFIFENKITIDARMVNNSYISPFLSRLIHGSLYLCPALLVSHKEFVFCGSGGCQIGSFEDKKQRPINHVLSVCEKFGCKVTNEETRVLGKIYNQTMINELDIIEYSLKTDSIEGPLVGGATKTALIMSLLLNDTFVIKNAYIKTDVIDMMRFLKLLGKEVEVHDNDISIKGQIQNGLSVTFELTQCVSEIITYSTLAIISGKKIAFKELNRSIIERSIKAELDIFNKMGVKCIWDNKDLLVSLEGELKGCDIDVLPDTIQSDHQPFFVLLLLFSNTKSLVSEYVWKDRFMYVDNIKKMGGHIVVCENKATVYPSKLSPTSSELTALDVRSAAVSLLAMIATNSKNDLIESEHILRGYSRIKENLEDMGVTIDICSY